MLLVAGWQSCCPRKIVSSLMKVSETLAESILATVSLLSAALSPSRAKNVIFMAC